MKTLGADWITDKHIDFEYKKYVLLDYLQDVNQNFEASKLYCQSQYNYYWCLTASKNSSGVVSGNSFVWLCTGDPHITVTSSSLSITGTSITCNVYYTEDVGGGGPTLPHNFNFSGTKN